MAEENITMDLTEVVESESEEESEPLVSTEEPLVSTEEPISNEVTEEPVAAVEEEPAPEESVVEEEPAPEESVVEEVTEESVVEEVTEEPVVEEVTEEPVVEEPENIEGLFKVGDKVKSLFSESSMIRYNATISEVHDGGLEYTLEWEDSPLPPPVPSRRQPVKNIVARESEDQ
jgi:hypothetical protein